MILEENRAMPILGSRERRRAIVSSVIGNGLEWFDFGIYGVFAVMISRIFFPANDPTTSLMLATATFGLAFVVRPLGGILIGRYADRAGRKAALSLIILMMAVGTGMIGVVPSYAAIGIAAPILIIAARMLQGFSAGGEFASATAMLFEFSPKGRRGFIGSFQMCSQAFAFALGGGVAYLLTKGLAPADLESWGWRLPFLFGVLIGPIGYYIRSRVDETPEFVAFMKLRASSPMQHTSFGDILGRYPRQLFSSFGIVVVGTAASYVVLLFIPFLAAPRMGITASDSQLALLAGSVVLLVLCPLAGHLSDRFGRSRIMLPAVIAYGLLAYPMLSWLIANPTGSNLVIYELVSCALMSFFWGPSPAALAEAFPVEVRSTSVSLAYNFGVMIFGGLAPFFNTWLSKATGNPSSPAFYMIATAMIGTLAMLLMNGKSSRLQQAVPA